MLNVLPYPKIVNGSLNLHAHHMGIVCEQVAWSEAVRWFISDLNKVFELSEPQNDGVYIIQDCSLGADEYKIDINDCAVYLTASELRELNHAFSTLLMLGKAENGLFMLPNVQIHDNPDKSYRGLMLDLARYWHPYTFLLDAVDICRTYKISTLHLHFVDDQAYTLPSKIFPALPCKDRHYTEEQIHELVCYAHARGVTLLPEIEMPGHCSRMQAAYPEIFGTSGIIRASEDSFQALNSIIQEVITLFPYSPCIHIGGDEADTERWLWDDDSRDYMTKHGFIHVRELYTDFVSRIVDMVLQNGKTPMVWEGFPAAGNSKIDKRCLVFAWESLYQTAPSLLNAGFQVINASWVPMYIVPPDTYWSPRELESWNVYTWKNWWNRSEAYHNDILVPPSNQVLGGQLCVWGDRMSMYENTEEALRDELRLIRERIHVLSERTWNADRPKEQHLYPIMQHTDRILQKYLRNA